MDFDIDMLVSSIELVIIFYNKTNQFLLSLSADTFTLYICSYYSYCIFSTATTYIPVVAAAASVVKNIELLMRF